jgi:hypothetical protein
MQTIDELIDEKVRLAVADAMSRIKLPTAAAPAAPASQPRRVLDSKAAAEYIGLSHHRLAKLREMHRGPAYKKLGVKVVYEVADLDAYLNELPVFERPVRS